MPPGYRLYACIEIKVPVRKPVRDHGRLAEGRCEQSREAAQTLGKLLFTVPVDVIAHQRASFDDKWKRLAKLMFAVIDPRQFLCLAEPVISASSQSLRFDPAGEFQREEGGISITFRKGDCHYVNCQQAQPDAQNQPR